MNSPRLIRRRGVSVDWVAAVLAALAAARWLPAIPC
jgi:hypothetical protein